MPFRKKQKNSPSNGILSRKTLYFAFVLEPKKMCEIMKKVIAIAAIAFLGLILVSSCKSTKCAAYGEVHNYQKEVRY